MFVILILFSLVFIVRIKCLVIMIALLNSVFIEKLLKIVQERNHLCESYKFTKWELPFGLRNRILKLKILKGLIQLFIILHSLIPIFFSKFHTFFKAILTSILLSFIEKLQFFWKSFSQSKVFANQRVLMIKFLASTFTQRANH